VHQQVRRRKPVFSPCRVATKPSAQNSAAPAPHATPSQAGVASDLRGVSGPPAGSLIAEAYVRPQGRTSHADAGLTSASAWVTLTHLLGGKITMNGNRYYGVRVEGAKYGVGFGSALAIAISYTNNHSILWAIIHGIFGWLYVIYYALFG
jgi:hypothetical protein